MLVWLTRRERTALTLLGASALAGFAVLAWQQQRAPIRFEAVATPVFAQWTRQLVGAAQVDLNAASVDELERLPGIGPSLARRIADDRSRHGRFNSPEDVRRVPGIGPTLFEQLRHRVITK